MNEILKKEIILNHYEHPSNRKVINDNSYDKINTNNDSCIDNIDIYIKVEDNFIKDLKFYGEACAISTASSSIATENLIGLSITDAISYIDNFDNMINQKEYNADTLNEAVVFDEIYKQNNRKNCAFLPYKNLKKYLEKYL